MSVKLTCPAQNYAWGKIGSDSLVGRLAMGEKVENKPYAELWMSTHPNGPAKIGEKFLTEFLVEEMLGIDGYKNELPFLLKVLSVNTALSIQAHPDNVLGKYLFEKDPKNYKDPNHKPEICIALGKFEAFAGFKKMDKISQHLDKVKEFRNLVGESVAQEFQQTKTKESFKLLFSAWMKAPVDVVKSELRALVHRVENVLNKMDVDPLEALVVRLSKDYPDDVGCFAPFVLNYTVLEDGESLFLGPNEPHAYIYGECIECMACSDNVVRAGLTPKFRDTQVLIEMCTYDDSALENTMKLNKKVYNDCVDLYIPPVKEFLVCRVKLDGQKTSLVLPCASIFIVIDGSGFVNVSNTDKSSLNVTKGDIYFSSKGSMFEFSSSGKMLAFVATCNKI